MNEYRLIDVDNHYYEPDDCFSRHIDSRHAAVAFRPVDVGGGMRRWTSGDRSLVFHQYNPSDVAPPPGALADFLAGKEGLRFFENVMRPLDHPSFVERRARLQVLDEQGIEAVVILPTVGVLLESEFTDRPSIVCANYRSFNRWVEDEWGYGADGRIFAVPLLTLLDPEWAVDELVDLAARGARLFYLRMAPVGGTSPADPRYDRFWDAVQESGVRPVFHLDNCGLHRTYGALWGEDPAKPLVEFTAMQYFIAFGERAAHDAVGALILHNLFGRFPGIELLTIEVGSSWVAPLLRSMDKAAKMGQLGSQLGGALEESPSDVFRRHVYVNPYPEDDLFGLAQLIGADHVLFGSDYPHPEGLSVPASFADGLRGLPDADVRLIMRDNAARLLGSA